MSLDFHQSRYAIEAAVHGRFLRAARILDVAQSTPGRPILKLERWIGLCEAKWIAGLVTWPPLASRLSREPPGMMADLHRRHRRADMRPGGLATCRCILASVPGVIDLACMI